MILGTPNDADARYVEGTGLFLAVRKGDRRWVTGDAVDAGLRSGVLVLVYTGESPALTTAQLAAQAHGQTATPEPEPVQVSSPAPPDASLSSLPATPPAATMKAPKAAQVAKKAPAARKPVKKAAAKKS